jgi:hypothetical protein
VIITKGVTICACDTNCNRLSTEKTALDNSRSVEIRSKGLSPACTIKAAATLENLYITSSSILANPVEVISTSGWKMVGCTLASDSFGIWWFGWAGVLVKDACGSLIKCHFHKCRDNGLLVKGHSNIELEECHFDLNKIGLRVSGHDSVTALRCIFDSNKDHDVRVGGTILSPLFGRSRENSEVSLNSCTLSKTKEALLVTDHSDCTVTSSRPPKGLEDGTFQRRHHANLVVDSRPE